MKNGKTYFALIFIGIVYIISLYNYKPYRAMYAQSEGDAFGYYVYLPAFFIHHDLANLHATITAKYTHCCPLKKADSSYQNKYFMGTAFLQAPFFLIAHLLASHFHQPSDGFSMVYMYAVIFSCLAYCLLGLLFLSLVLRRQFSDFVVAFVIIILALATNLYYLVVAQAPFCHVYLFFLYSFLVFVSDKFYETSRRQYLLLIGFICGLIVLTRLNEVYVLLIPLLWGMSSRTDWIERYRFIKKNFFYVIAAGVIMVLCLLPQMLYWKVSSGHFIHYSYSNEKFDFLHPQIWKGLTIGTNGWLLFCPIMIFALTGTWFLYRHRHRAISPILVFMPLHIYIIYSWWCWFYMGSYGSRPMTEVYALLCFPLAYSVEWFCRSILGRLALGVITVFFSFVIMSHTYLSVHNLFMSELSNWRFNFLTLGKSKITYTESVVMDCSEFQPVSPTFVKIIYENNFEALDIDYSDTVEIFSGHRSLRLSQGRSSPIFSTSLAASGIRPKQWIKASVECFTKEAANNIWNKSSLVIALYHNNKIAEWHSVFLDNRIDNPDNEVWHFTTGKWGNVYFYSQIPISVSSNDVLKVFVSHCPLGVDLYVDDMKVELFDTPKSNLSIFN